MDQRASRLMESYAFRRSIKHMYRGRWNSLAFSISVQTENKWSAQPLPLQKAKLALTQEQFSFGFHMIQDGFLKTLPGVLRRASPR